MHKFSVSEARTAAACPRIFYFDVARHRAAPDVPKKVTRIWVEGGGVAGGIGRYFHDQIERFQKKARTAQELQQAVAEAAAARDEEREERIVGEFVKFMNEECLDHAGLHSKSVPAAQAFIKAVQVCMRRFAAHVQYGLSLGHSMPIIFGQLFGDLGKRVDVTFKIGPERIPVRVVGAIDFIFRDLTTGRERILDYKLTPAGSPSKDVLQSALYALMHHQQHRTMPGVCVVYLHPDVRNVSVEWDEVVTQQGVILSLLASMAAWADFNEATGVGLKPPGEPAVCDACRWRNECEKRLGPKSEGARYTIAVPVPSNPTGDFDGPVEVEVHDPPEPAPEEEADDESPPTVSEAMPGSEAVGLVLGSTTDGRPVGMPLHDLTMHAAVCGSAGSGKTWMAKAIVEEVLRQGVPAILVDPQGDLVQFVAEAALPADATIEERRLQREFRDGIDVRIWTPGTSHAGRLSLPPFSLPDGDDLRGVESPERRTEELHAMLGAAASSLVRFAAARGDEQVQQAFVHEVLRKLSEHRLAGGGRPAREVTVADVVAVLMDPESCGIDDPSRFISKAEREKLARKVNALVAGPASTLFVGGTPLNIDAFITPGRTGRTPLNILYLNAIPDDTQKRFVVATVASEVYRWMISTSSSGAMRLLWFVDEAKDYLPAGTAKPMAKEPLVRLFSQGRKYGVGCVICTQSPRSVDYNVFANANTKLIGRIEASQDLERVRDWFGHSGSPPAWLDGRLGAQDKSFVGRWPSIARQIEGTAFRARRLFSLHEGAWSPERVEQACRGRADTVAGGAAP